MLSIVNSKEVNNPKNYFRNYKLVCENILDVINSYGDLGVTSEEITNFIGIRPSQIRRDLAKMINRINSKKYFYRKREGSFKYYKVTIFNPEIAYQDIINSKYEKVTLNQNGLKNSIIKLPYNYELFPNVMDQLKKSKSTWLSVCDLAQKLGVNNEQGKSSIKEELNRDLKCSVKFIECKIEDNIKKYRLIYKFRKFTILELKEIANRTFPQDKQHKISGHSIQALNNFFRNGVIVNE